MKINGRNTGLDVLRSVAILFVLFLHASELNQNLPLPVLQLSSFGWFGVDIFFVLSGFLIADQFFRSSSLDPKKQCLAFYLRRFFRTLPLYFLVLFCYTIIKPRLGFPFQGSPIQYLFFLQNYTGNHDFVPSWSLCIEEQFYLFFPLLVFAWHKVKAPALFWLLPLAISVMARYFFVKANFAHTFSIDFVSNELMFKTHLHLDGLSLGVFMAATQSRWRAWNARKSIRVGLFGAAILLTTLWHGGFALQGWAAVYSFFGFSLGIAMLLPSLVHLKLSHSWDALAQRIALLSFGVYLWNDVVSRLMHKLALEHWALSYPIFFAASFLIALFSYQLLELKFLNIREKILLRLGLSKR